MSDFCPTHLWVYGYGENISDWLEIKALQFGRRPTRSLKSPAWYAHRSNKTHYLAGDDVGELHTSWRSWLWCLSSSAKTPEPPFLLTNDACLFPAYDGAVRIDPSPQVRGRIESGQAPGPVHFAQSLAGSGWIGVLLVTRAESKKHRGRLIAFSATGKIADTACRDVVMPYGIPEGPFGAIELLNRGPI